MKEHSRKLFAKAVDTIEGAEGLLNMDKKLFLKSETSFFCTRTARNPRKKDNFLKPFSVKVSEIRDVRVQKRS